MTLRIMVKYQQMRIFVIAILLSLSASASAASRIEMSALPPSECADTEVSTNVALKVNTARLERLTFVIAFESCDTNEVLVALGADADSNGDLSESEADIVFGCDCGAWYRADLQTGETMRQTANALVVGKHEFDPSWNLAKVIRRGFGEINELVSVDEERVRFDIRIR